MFKTCVIAYLSFCVGTLPAEMKVREGGLHNSVAIQFNETDSANYFEVMIIFTRRTLQKFHM